MSAYRAAPALARVAPRTPLVRLLWAWCRGVPRRMQARQRRLEERARRLAAWQALGVTRAELADAVVEGLLMGTAIVRPGPRC